MEEPRYGHASAGTTALSEATNNRAERQLRPAVIRRKVSTGNKTHTGARTWQILASLAETAAQTGQSFIDQVAQAMSLAPHP